MLASDDKPGSRQNIALLEDRSLTLEVDGEFDALLERWLPRFRARLDGGAEEPRAVIHLSAGGAAAVRRPPDEIRRTFALDTIEAWVAEDARSVALASRANGAAGTIDLERLRATLGPGERAEDAETRSQAEWAVYSMLTISAALLLGRMGRALVHSGAVVTPGGAAWLLVGDAFSGKSTTTANLITAGWDYASDDQGVLYQAPNGGLRIEGWPRIMHMDESWESGESPVRRRRDFNPDRLGPGRWRSDAPVAGLLFPRVEADSPTTLFPMARGAALAALLRQTPWLLADRVAAPRILDVLRLTATLPSHELRLGMDSYKDGQLLARRLAVLERE